MAAGNEAQHSLHLRAIYRTWLHLCSTQLSAQGQRCHRSLLQSTVAEPLSENTACSADLLRSWGSCVIHQLTRDLVGLAATFQACSDQQLCILRMLQSQICNLAFVFLFLFDGGSSLSCSLLFFFFSLHSKILLLLHLLHLE